MPTSLAPGHAGTPPTSYQSVSAMARRRDDAGPPVHDGVRRPRRPVRLVPSSEAGTTGAGVPTPRKEGQRHSPLLPALCPRRKFSWMAWMGFSAPTGLTRAALRHRPSASIRPRLVIGTRSRWRGLRRDLRRLPTTDQATHSLALVTGRRRPAVSLRDGGTSGTGSEQTGLPKALSRGLLAHAEDWHLLPSTTKRPVRAG